MRLRPSSAEMVEGETNKLTFDLAPAIGPNTISGTPTLVSDCGDLVFTDTAVDGPLLTTFVSGGQAGRDYIVTLTSVIASGETKVASITLEWKKPGHDERTGNR